MQRAEIFGTPLEAVTSAVPVINTDHEAIHAGWGFSAAYYAEGIADDATLIVSMIAPASGKVVHLKQYKPWGEGGLAKLEVFESPTITVAGTGITPANRERAFSAGTLSTVTVAHTPTVTVSGTLLDGPILFGGGGAGGGSGGQHAMDQEIVLARGKTIIIKLTNLAGAAKAMGLWLFWYEEE